jgi:DNA topoisomerase-3
VVRERVVLREGKTTPPAAFTEATLLTAMEHALHGLVDEHELEQGEAAPEGGLGTPATRASTLETLVARRYIERDGKRLISTELGRQVIAALPQGQLTSASWTAKWEQALTRIEQGKLTSGQFMSKAREFTRVVVQQLIAGPAPTMRDMTAVSDCPVCKKGQIKSFEKGWSCTNRADKCSFIIWRELCGKALTEAQVRDLLAGKTTRTLKGFTSKAGKTFDAALTLDKEGRVQMVFDKK